jgi:hypothetical protein
MEIAALLALGGAGFFIAQQTQAKPVARKEIPRKEGFVTTPQQTKTKSRAELDLMYNTLMSTPPPPADPRPGIKGLPGSMRPELQDSPMDYAPTLSGSLDAATSQVVMNVGGVEEEPVYVEGDYIISPLSGERIRAADFKHNNMQPFFGSRVRQNVDVSANTNKLDFMTGSGVNQLRKKEVETMFDTGQTPYGNVYGLESSTGFIESRINDPRNRAGEKPFEPVRVGPGLGEKFGATGKGGFQQIEVNDHMMKTMRRTDDLRTANNPKLTYAQPVVPGKHFIGGAASQEEIGDVRKYRPDTFFINEGAERFGPSTAEVQKETARSIQVMRNVTRPETSVSYTGPAQSVDYNTSYVVGSYRSPMTQQYGPTGYRNADATGYTTADTDAPNHDYGREGFENRPNERDATRERVMGLNLAPADGMGPGTAHFTDPTRPTRRAETVGNLRQAGVATGYAGGTPAITVWDPNDIARTTVRETTIDNNRFGIAGPADGPTKLMVYDPDDIARPTQKHQISAKSEYFGAGVAAHQRSMSQTAAHNMRLNPSKQVVAKGRKPLAGNGNIGVFTGQVKQTTKKLDADYVNDRAPAVNYVPGVPAGVADIGSVQYRTPLKLDVSSERFNADMVSVVEQNPLNISLRKNAERDQNVLDYLTRDRGIRDRPTLYAPMSDD